MRTAETVRTEVKQISSELTKIAKACAKKGAINKMSLEQREKTLARMEKLNYMKSLKLTAIIAATTNLN